MSVSRRVTSHPKVFNWPTAGCVFFGVRLFSECCALEKVGIITEKPCRLANGAVIAPYVFESCAKLSQIHLPQVCAMTDIVTPSSPPGGLSHGSFHSAGIRCVKLGEETIFLGRRAFENCKQLFQVDISSTKLDHLHMHTFSHCQSLQKVILPPGLREIRAEAFVGCTALTSIALPEQIRYIGHRAFGGCSKLAHLAYRRSRKTTWRRPYAAHNAFEDCHALDTPWWLHYIPPDGTDWMVPPSHHT